MGYCIWRNRQSMERHSRFIPSWQELLGKNEAEQYHTMIIRHCVLHFGFSSFAKDSVTLYALGLRRCRSLNPCQHFLPDALTHLFRLWPARAFSFCSLLHSTPHILSLFIYFLFRFPSSFQFSSSSILIHWSPTANLKPANLVMDVSTHVGKFMLQDSEAAPAIKDKHAWIEPAKKVLPKP